MHYMLIANLHNVSKDVYINAHMVIIMNNANLLRLLMIYIEFSPQRIFGDDWLYHALFCDTEM